MATPAEKLALSLDYLKSITDNEVAIKSSELSRVHRERLIKNGFIKEVIKGWYISVPPDEQAGDSTSWFASYWKFCTKYLNDRYGINYCISAEQSIAIHAGNWTVPQQIIIRATNGNNFITSFVYNTSIFTMRSNLLNEVDVINIKGIRMLSLPSALIRCTPIMFERSPMDMRTALTMIQDSSELLGILLDGGHTVIAGRLAGAFRNIGQDRIAKEIMDTMKRAGYDVREADPFESKVKVELATRVKSPYINRLKLMWHEMRDDVIKIFPKAATTSINPDKYIKHVEDIYVTDAYHSLSIERYKVTPELIERVRSGNWNPERNKEDKAQRDAMAARGYWQATQAVRKSLKSALNGKNPGTIWDEDHGEWFGELFAPSVATGILKPSDLAGYRNHQVYIGKSRHVPMNKDAVRDAMPELSELLKKETEPAVRVVLGHFIFVFIHPYMDGNGRIGRFLMNLMLAAGGYPWTVIPVEERDAYMNSLEKASADQDIKPFASFLAHLVKAGIQGKPIAKLK